MSPRAVKERVFFAVLEDEDLEPTWQRAEGASYGLPPNAYLDLGGEDLLAWVIVVCRGRGCTIACEEVWYEDFYDVAPEAAIARSFRISRQGSPIAGESWKRARDQAALRRDRAGEFEIFVAFRDCLERSSTLARAWREGPLRTENCGWTSQPPIEPVTMRYTLAQIRSVFDDERGYFSYEKSSDSS